MSNAEGPVDGSYEVCQGETRRATCDNKLGGHLWMETNTSSLTAGASKLEASEVMTKQEQQQ